MEEGEGKKKKRKRKGVSQQEEREIRKMSIGEKQEIRLCWRYFHSWSKGLVLRGCGGGRREAEEARMEEREL